MRGDERIEERRCDEMRRWEDRGEEAQRKGGVGGLGGSKSPDNADIMREIIARYRGGGMMGKRGARHRMCCRDVSVCWCVVKCDG